VLALYRPHRDAALADTEKRAQIAVARGVQHHALAELVVGDPFAGRENVVHRLAQDSLG
jgi:hypothetical protein